MSEKTKLEEVVSKAKTDEETNCWKKVPLSKVIEPVLGKTPQRSESEYWEGDIKWASAKDISSNSTRKIYDTEEKMTEAGKKTSNAPIMPENTVVVVARGSVGEVAQLGEPMTFNQTCYGLRTNDELLDDYLYYAWKYVLNRVLSITYGTIFDTITMHSFKDIEIPLPPIKEQRKIANIFSVFDDKIETNNKINRLLEEIAQIIFKSWFVDFEPYNEFKDSELGKIPKEFEVTTFSEICKTCGGGTPSTKKDEYWGGKNFWLTPSEVTSLNSPIAYDTERKITEEGLNEGSAKIMQSDSVLLTSRATVGEVVVNKEPMSTNQGFICVEPNENIPTYFMMHLIRSKRPSIENRASGSTYPEISQTSFNGIKIAIPPKEDSKKFEKIANQIYSKIYVAEIENDKLSNLRETLLKKLISGEIRVGD